MNALFPFPRPVYTGTFISRPQRFLAEIKLRNGRKILAYCANPGAFNGCCVSDCPVLVWKSQNKERKRRFTWRAIRIGRTWVGVDTHLANILVERSLALNGIKALDGYRVVRKEPCFRDKTRLDFLLRRKESDCYVEVKSATIVSGRSAVFPDSISPRAIKHLKKLKDLRLKGSRAVVIFLVQRNDVDSLVVNRDFSSEFKSACNKALSTGVEFIAMKHSLDINGFKKGEQIPIQFT